MNILLLNPPYLKEDKIFMKEIGRCGSTASGNQFWPQTGLAYLAAMAKRDHKVEIIDAIATRIDFEQVIKNVIQFKPDIVVIHTTTPTFRNDSTALEKIKKNITDSLIGFVGTHVSNTAKDSMKNSQADFIIINEPELTFIDIVQNINDLSTVKGIAYRDDESIIINPLREINNNLNDLPFPARDLLPNHRYKMVLTDNEPFATVVPSRGCPYSCIYCRVGYPWGKKFRKRSAKNVIDEMIQIQNKYGINRIVFMADTFTLDKQWVIDLCRMIISNELDIEWMCNSRIDSIDEDMIINMKRAGCTLISYGIESGSQKLLDMAKKNLDLSKAKKTIKNTKKHGIRAFAYFIIGLPGEDEETIQETIDLSKELDPDYVNFHIATPHPGTELYQIAHQNKWIVDYDYDHYDQSGDYSVMKNEKLSAEQIHMAQKDAMKKFYLRPKKLIQEIKKIRKPQDIISRVKIGYKILVNKG